MLIFALQLLWILLLWSLYQALVKPLFKSVYEVSYEVGAWKEVQDIGRELKDTCAYVDGLEGLTVVTPSRRSFEVILHGPRGVLFLSCAPPAQRSKWIPGLYKYDTSAAGAGYIATYDPSSKKATKLTADGFESPRGLSPFGMDAVPSAHNPGELTIYVINIRPPFVDLDPNLPPGIREAKRDEIATALAKREGPDPCIEVFQYVLGSESMQYVATWADEKIMISLGDVVGLPDGTGSWFTNVVHYKADMSNGPPPTPEQMGSSIGFCGASGCKFAATGLSGAWGIARSPFHSNDTFYVGNTFSGGVSLFARRSDNRLIFDEHIDTESPLDKLMVDSTGAIWAVGMPDPDATAVRILDPTEKTSAPSNVFKIVLNICDSSSCGEKYSVQKVLEDDGTRISGVASAAQDATRGKLFMHGFSEESLIVCETK